MSGGYFNRNQHIVARPNPVLTKEGGGRRSGFGSLLHAKIDENSIKKLELKVGEVLGEDGPKCVSEEEIAPEALKKECNRAKGIVAGLFKNPLKGNHNTPCTIVPSSSGSGGGGVISFMDSDEQPTVPAPPTKSSKRPRSNSEEGSSNKDKQIKAAAITTSDATRDLQQVKRATTVAATSADIGQLKNIFHRQGGVDWSDTTVEVTSATAAVEGVGGDEDSASAAALLRRGGGEDDELFRQAEKFGYDIRGAGAGAGAGGGSADGGESGGCGSFSFGFYEEPEESKEATHQVEADDAGTGAVAASDSRDKGTTKVEQKLTGATAAGRYHQLPPLLRRKLISLPNTLDILRTAKLFCRQKSESELISAWKENKEQLMLDYKKKRKDALRSKKKRMERQTH